ncbi:unnamed protein product [Cuscuta campestris]|uniref:DNA-directed RNA polymerase I subunit rpa49 n=1 Tax=Cuscuta campestris TaxID=132261 RepID=A0A484NQV6_9ASTE|nr:unnamed protein product [Cuscuta campestris]
MGRKVKKLDTGNPISDHCYGEAGSLKANITKSENPKKNEKMTVKIQVLSQSAQKIPPIVGYFPSGFDPLKESMEDDETENTSGPVSRVSLFKNTKRTNRFQLVVSGSQVNFVGTNFSGEATAAQSCSYSIGVLDKETQTLKIVPIAGNMIIRLDPKIDGEEEEEDNTAKREMTEEEKKAQKKAREMILPKKTVNLDKKIETLRQGVNAGGDHVIEGSKLLNQDALEEVPFTDDYDRNIPPYDLAATTPETAYPLHKIIFKGEWDYLTDIFDLSEAGERISPNAYPSFVCNRMHTLADIKSEEERRKLARIFSYITHLVKFKDKHSMDGFQSAKNHRFPKMLFRKFSSMFCVPESKRLPNEKVDLLISYVLVLTLYADNFRSNPSDIAKDLRTITGHLRPRLELLGCNFVRDEKRGHLATLSVPLTFPTVKRKRKRG